MPYTSICVTTIMVKTFFIRLYKACLVTMIWYKTESDNHSTRDSQVLCDRIKIQMLNVSNKNIFTRSHVLTLTKFNLLTQLYHFFNTHIPTCDIVS